MFAVYQMLEKTDNFRSRNMLDSRFPLSSLKRISNIRTRISCNAKNFVVESAKKREIVLKTSMELC